MKVAEHTIFALGFTVRKRSVRGRPRRARAEEFGAVWRGALRLARAQRPPQATQDMRRLEEEDDERRPLSPPKTTKPRRPGFGRAHVGDIEMLHPTDVQLRVPQAAAATSLTQPFPSLTLKPT